jgi:phenylpropionate dioxygenase-like ring-hydroxylating dioxygenase large terminal subunit
MTPRTNSLRIGWSYSFDGKLAKAPKYQEIPAFDKEENGLYKVHVHVDMMGFVWVNLDANETPTIPWGKDFAAVDEQSRYGKFDMSKYSFHHQWEMVGNYNWKTLADNYNEVCNVPVGSQYGF